MRRLRGAFGSIRVRLLLSFWLLSVAPLGLLGWFMLRALDQFYLDRLLDDMASEAALIADAISAELANGQVVGAAELVNNPPPPLRSQARVLVIDTAGELLAASAPLPASPTAEPGLSQALQGIAARGVDRSPALAVPVAFAAQPILAGGQVVGAVHLAYTLADIQTALAQIRNWLLMGMGLLALLALLVSLELAGRIIQPLDRLRAAAHALASGHFERRVPVEAPAELADVAASFNQMAAALQEAEQARQAMFANLAHDVRTPLGSIRAAAEALAAGAADQPELRARLLAGLVTQTTYLRRLTDDMLRLASYEGGRLNLQPAAVAIQPLLDQALESLAPTAQERRLTLQLDVPPGVPAVWADADRLLEVLFNLLDNAVQHTPPGGTICVVARGPDPDQPNPDQVNIHVQDTGPGLPAEVRRHVFERFWSGEAGRPGSLNMGLGLSIAQAIVAAHGGRIGVTDGPGGGADFFFSLPLTSPA